MKPRRLKVLAWEATITAAAITALGAAWLGDWDRAASCIGLAILLEVRGWRRVN